MEPPVPRSRQVEDYVKTIYSMAERAGDPVTTSGLSERLGLSASSVSGMLRRLTTQGLLDHQPYGGITLTEAGRSAALAVVRRHRLLEMFLVARLDYGWDEVHDEAEELEHAVSERLLERIDLALGRPEFDPHGDPIPSPLGAMPQVAAQRLSTLSPGRSGVLVRVDDHDPRVLQHLDEVGIGLGARVELVQKLPFDGGWLVRVGAGSGVTDAGVGEHSFPPALAGALWIGSDPADARPA